MRLATRMVVSKGKSIIIIDTSMGDTLNHDVAALRLWQLTVPTFPIGGFTYSQGLEYAIESGRLKNQFEITDWIEGCLVEGIGRLEIPLLRKMIEAYEKEDISEFARWTNYLVASRETKELRIEEHQRGEAFYRITSDLGLSIPDLWQDFSKKTHLGGFSIALSAWSISLHMGAQGYAMSWLEGLISAAIKLLPMGQTDGQKMLMKLSTKIPEVVRSGLRLEDDDFGGSMPMVALCSSLHETQYTRLFRS